MLRQHPVRELRFRGTRDFWRDSGSTAGQSLVLRLYSARRGGGDRAVATRLASRLSPDRFHRTRVEWWRQRWRDELVTTATIAVAESDGQYLGFVTVDPALLISIRSWWRRMRGAWDCRRAHGGGQAHVSSRASISTSTRTTSAPFVSMKRRVQHHRRGHQLALRRTGAQDELEAVSGARPATAGGVARMSRRASPRGRNPGQAQASRSADAPCGLRGYLAR